MLKVLNMLSNNLMYKRYIKSDINPRTQEEDIRKVFCPADMDALRPASY